MKHNLSVFLWWIFVYNGWPFRQARAASRDLWSTTKRAGLVAWHFLRIPLQPVAAAGAFLFDKGIRADVRKLAALNARPRRSVELRGTLSVPSK